MRVSEEEELVTGGPSDDGELFPAVDPVGLTLERAMRRLFEVEITKRSCSKEAVEV